MSTLEHRYPVVMAPSGVPRKLPQYPEPLVVSPRSGTHAQSLIVLHGRGSNGEKFGLELLKTLIPGFGTLPTAFPDAKFIFPTAAKRRAQIYKRTPIHQWFDNWSLKTPTEREELQFDGLRESTEFIHRLLDTEIAAVGASNVILWGLSQGCAISLVALLLWQREKLGAAIGMCGWLPLRQRMEDTLAEDDDAGNDENNPFAQGSSACFGTNATEEDGILKIDKIVEYLREELQVPSELKSSTASEIPIFLGHGTEDEKVPLSLGKEAAALLRQVDLDVEYKEYQGLGHWYSGEMLCDIVCFIQRQAKSSTQTSSKEVRVVDE